VPACRCLRHHGCNCPARLPGRAAGAGRLWQPGRSSRPRRAVPSRSHPGARPMELTDFEALSFDCYGTLIDWEAGLLAVLGPWARTRGLDLTGEELLTAYAQVEAAVEAEHPAEAYPEVLARGMRLLGENLGAEVTGEDAARLARSVPGWPAFPDSPAALAALGRRFKLIILSNVDRASFAGSNARLGADFTSIITAQDVGSYKPSP